MAHEGGSDGSVDVALVDGPPRVFGQSAGRPVSLLVPKAYDPAQPIPLVLVLHGYGANGWLQATLLGYTEQLEKGPFLLAYPNGTTDPGGKLFWNATDACCDYYGAGIDDSAYLLGLIQEIEAAYNVDLKRVYLIGHSNGGFMAYRMACDHADRIAAIISLAGATYFDTTACKPAAPVSVVQIHGDQDTSILYGGGTTKNGAYPGAVASTGAWALYNGCGSTRDEVPPTLDLDSLVSGPETVVERYAGCPSGVDVELWTIKGGGHLPVPTSTFAQKTWEFFQKHPAP